MTQNQENQQEGRKLGGWRKFLINVIAGIAPSVERLMRKGETTEDIKPEEARAVIDRQNKKLQKKYGPEYEFGIENEQFKTVSRYRGQHFRIITESTTKEQKEQNKILTLDFVGSFMSNLIPSRINGWCDRIPIRDLGWNENFRRAYLEALGDYVEEVLEKNPNKYNGIQFVGHSIGCYSVAMLQKLLEEDAKKPENERRYKRIHEVLINNPQPTILISSPRIGKTLNETIGHVAPTALTLGPEHMSKKGGIKGFIGKVFKFLIGGMEGAKRISEYVISKIPLFKEEDKQIPLFKEEDKNLVISKKKEMQEYLKDGIKFQVIGGARKQKELTDDNIGSIKSNTLAGQQNEKNYGTYFYFGDHAIPGDLKLDRFQLFALQILQALKSLEKMDKQSKEYNNQKDKVKKLIKNLHDADETPAKDNFNYKVFPYFIEIDNNSGAAVVIEGVTKNSVLDENFLDDQNMGLIIRDLTNYVKRYLPVLTKEEYDKLEVSDFEVNDEERGQIKGALKYYPEITKTFLREYNVENKFKKQEFFKALEDVETFVDAYTQAQPKKENSNRNNSVNVLEGLFKFWNKGGDFKKEDFLKELKTVKTFVEVYPKITGKKDNTIKKLDEIYNFCQENKINFVDFADKVGLNDKEGMVAFAKVIDGFEVKKVLSKIINNNINSQEFFKFVELYQMKNKVGNAKKLGDLKVQACNNFVHEFNNNKLKSHAVIQFDILFSKQKSLSDPVKEKAMEILFDRMSEIDRECRIFKKTNQVRDNMMQGMLDEFQSKLSKSDANLEESKYRGLLARQEESKRRNIQAMQTIHFR